MSDANQNLLVRFRLDNSQAITAARQYEAALREQNQQFKQTATTAVQTVNSVKQVGGISKQTKGFLQQLGYQAADFTIVMQQGQGALQAFAVQGGQLISFLGPYGALIGGAVTVTGLLTAAWLNATGAGRSFKEQIEDLQDAVKEYANTVELLNKSPADLAKEFGRSSGGVVSIFDLKQLLDEKKALEELQESMSRLQEQMVDDLNTTQVMIENQQKLTVSTDNLNKMRQEQFDMMEKTGAASEELNRQIAEEERRIERITAILGEQSNALGISNDEYLQLTDIMNRFNQSSTADEYVQNMAEFSEFIKQSGIDLETVDGELGKALRNMFAIADEAAKLQKAIDDAAWGTSKLAEGIQNAANWASNFADRMIEAAKAAKQAQINARNAAREKVFDAESQLAINNVELEARQQGLDELNTSLAVANEETNQWVRQQEEALGPQGALNAGIYEQAERLRQINDERIRGEQAIKAMDEAEREATRNAKSGASQRKKDLEELQREQEKFNETVKREMENTTLSFKDLAEVGVNGFVDALFDADQSFSDFARNFLIEIGKMIAKQILLNALTSALGGGNGMVLVPGVSPTGLQGFEAFAQGGIVNGPTLFPTGRGIGLMGEAGAEAIMPLKRGPGGDLGVAGPSITINNNAGADIEITRNDDEVIEIAVNRATDRIKSEFTRSMQTGQGTFARGIEQGYSTRRRAT